MHAPKYWQLGSAADLAWPVCSVSSLASISPQFSCFINPVICVVSCELINLAILILICRPLAGDVHLSLQVEYRPSGKRHLITIYATSSKGLTNYHSLLSSLVHILIMHSQHRWNGFTPHNAPPWVNIIALIALITTLIYHHHRHSSFPISHPSLYRSILYCSYYYFTVLYPFFSFVPSTQFRAVHFLKLTPPWRCR